MSKFQYAFSINGGQFRHDAQLEGMLRKLMNHQPLDHAASVLQFYLEMQYDEISISLEMEIVNNETGERTVINPGPAYSDEVIYWYAILNGGKQCGCCGWVYGCG